MEGDTEQNIGVKKEDEKILLENDQNKKPVNILFYFISRG